MLVQLRGGVVEVPGAKPVQDRPRKKRDGRSEADHLERRLASLGDSDIWKP
jgi:hypothetical protein